MCKVTVLGSIFLTLLFVTTTSAAQNAGSAWNSVAASYGFATYPAASSATFVDAYGGNNFNGDFASIMLRVSQIMGTRPPDSTGSDLLDATLQNWPDGSGM